MIGDLVRRHVELEEKFGDGDSGDFVSGWQCSNIYEKKISSIISKEANKLRRERYVYQSDFPCIEEGIKKRLSIYREGIIERVLLSSGATQLIWLVMSWLSIRGHGEVYYVSPIYHTMHFAAQKYGIRLRSANRLHPYEVGFGVNLPERQSVLILTNPVWYSGTRIPNDVISCIKKWQNETGSFILVDASFEGTEWSSDFSADWLCFDREKTAYILCPSKQLAYHGVRASYMLTPYGIHRELQTIYSMIFGSLPTETIAFLLAEEVLLSKQKLQKKIMQRAADMHSKLRKNRVIQAPWDPVCGYFCFERIDEKNRPPLLMGGNFFDQKRYPGFYRINLLSPSISSLC